MAGSLRLRACLPVLLRSGMRTKSSAGFRKITAACCRNMLHGWSARASLALRSPVGSPFNAVSDPTRWRDIIREFPYGAHEMWVAQRLFAIAVLHVNDGTLDLNLRNRPSLSLK